MINNKINNVSKYRVTIDLDLDFQSVFDKIPKGLFSESSGMVDEYYEKEMIYDCLKNPYLVALDKKMEALTKDKEDGMYKYLEHHLECEIQTSKQISKNITIEKL